VLTLPALKVQQFAQEFYLLNVAAPDVERLVKFEVLGDAGLEGKKPSKRRASPGSAVNWAEIEQRVTTSDKAYQRPILRKKIDELAQYYLQCRDEAGVPAIPGAVLLTSDEPIAFSAQGSNPYVGLAQLPETEGALRVLDGQHRLLALTALLASNVPESDRAAVRGLQVPAILFSGLPPPAVVEMFATINSKHTRLNASLLFSLKGRQLYGDPLDARIHDALRKLNDKDGSPLKGLIKMLGVGPGKVAQAGLANEIKATLAALLAKHPDAAWIHELTEHLDRFYDLYFRETARAFDDVWESKKHSVRSGIALRAFIQASAEVATQVWQVGGDPRPTVRSMLAPWRERIGSARFETAGAWRAKAAGGGKETTRLLARELVAALGAPTTRAVGA
jgi:DGQHR domain-containing protein